MIRFLLAAAAALSLSFAPAAFADCAHCKDCPMHKTAQADEKGAKPDTKAACACAGKEAKGECKCKQGCECPHCHAKQEKQEKKS